MKNNTNPERLYTVDELVAVLNFSRRTIIRLIETEPGVLVLQSSPDKQRKAARRYRTFRVPDNVLEKIRRRLLGLGD